MKQIEPYLQQIKALCDKHGVESLFVFGSVLTANFQSKSDIDFLVNFNDEDPLKYADHYFALKFDLEKLFNRNVDLLEQRAIKNPYFKQEIDRNKVMIYGS